MTPETQTTPYPTATRDMLSGSYLDWPAVLAGGVFAMALASLLISFGAGLGLSLTSPYRGEGVSAAWLAIAAAIWFAWVMVTSFGAGGYLAGRMRRRAGDATPDEVETRDGTHGLMVWATGVVTATLLAALGVGGFIGVGASAVGSASEAASEAAEAAGPEYFANVMLRGLDETGPAAAQGDAESADVAGSPAGAETTAGPAATGQPARASQGTSTLEAIDPAVQQEIITVLVRSAADGALSERDRSYLSRIVASYTGLDQNAAQARVDAVAAEIDAARARAMEAVEQARVAGVVFGFIAAATLLIGAIAAFFAATAGGHHRDEGLGFSTIVKRH